jgi:hypothetical protein
MDLVQVFPSVQSSGKKRSAASKKDKAQSCKGGLSQGYSPWS